jgi:Gpi18-like mannosyltransferase
MNYFMAALAILALCFALESNGVALVPLLAIAAAGVLLLASKPKGATGWRWQFFLCAGVWIMTAACAMKFYRP